METQADPRSSEFHIAGKLWGAMLKSGSVQLHDPMVSFFIEADEVAGLINWLISNSQNPLPVETVKP